GNWFNNEIYGAPTDVPWKLRIYEWDTSAVRALVDAQGNPVVKGYFHPTFLYEALWCLLLAAFLVWLGRRHSLRSGQVFAAYVMGYPVGRIVIENMRSDSANLIFGQRVNTWVSILVFLLGAYLWRRFGRMEQPLPPAPSDESHPSGAGADVHTRPDPDIADRGAEDPSAGEAPDASNDTASAGSEADRPAQS
ncbi:MAG: prolipoprotein diacylglyceryl transferase, partial [Dermatophilaceae bacterium]|nr:prolipoprotein diacylglyceryl transferase [Dermatophilaceae bacterium]